MARSKAQLASPNNVAITSSINAPSSLLPSPSTALQLVPSPSGTSGLRTGRKRLRWDDGIPPILRPILRAYLLGYASAVAPRVLTLVLQYITRRRKQVDAPLPPLPPPPHDGDNNGKQPTETFLVSLRRVLQGGLDWQRFPTFCAVLVGGSTLLEAPLKSAFDKLLQNLSDVARNRLSRFIASFIGAWLSLRLLQSKHTPGFTSDHDSPKSTKYAGHTLDLTFFAVTRALDVLFGEAWHRHSLRRQASGKWSRLEKAISHLADPAVFSLSSGLVMWGWFYAPSRLPRAYQKWITSAAAVDNRLIQALQRCHSGELRYGEETGQSHLLGSMCVDNNLPEHWGDPAKSIPFPCEIVHMGCGPSCEYHALSRFVRSFKWATATYLPLSLLLAIRNPNAKGVKRALLSAARSSAFLGAFISLFYYGVCLARTRVGPHVLGKDPQTRNRIDGGICVGTGCVLCGWSILLEKAGRRKDIGMFVAPRALATLFPRQYSIEKQWRETLAFSLSTAVVFTCVLENKTRVRGVLGSVLGSVLNAGSRA
ncbi:hypothetical protein QBC35DRAFT_94646 [Podospora australis]|uniref:Integral membrane protein n=1 Tax=Podospora australis TaxID=1536484 RepID=A0AAN7AL77_9PEZI|nr:hypothetical protein QBC35DRAFT_94646 [Podospora australis]